MSWALYRFQFEVLSCGLVKGNSFEEMGADLYGDGGQLTLDGLRYGLHPARLLGLCLTATALYTRRKKQKTYTQRRKIKQWYFIHLCILHKYKHLNQETSVLSMCHTI